jgi:fumarylacetoacetase
MPYPSTYSCLLEVFAQKHELPILGGKPMSWLEDGDGLTMEGWFKTADGSRGGFGGV